MTKHKFLLTLLLAFWCTRLICPTETGEHVEMADAMRSNGKIYVVVGIILIVLAGLILYLFLLDKKGEESGRTPPSEIAFKSLTNNRSGILLKSLYFSPFVANFTTESEGRVL